MREEFKILTYSGYWDRYFKLRGTDRERWTELEKELGKFGVQRYTSFESFRRCKYYYIDKQLKK